MSTDNTQSDSPPGLDDAYSAFLRQAPPAMLTDMGQAARELVACYQALADRRRNLLQEVLADTRGIEWEHYPPDDLIDHHGYCQSYYHAHSLEDRRGDEHGHFHVFARLRPLRRRPKPWLERGVSLPWRGDASTSSGNHDALVHLVAISMDRQGVPFQLFTTNQWVTNETWCAADDAIALLRRICVRREESPALVSRWLDAVLRLFQPQIELLLRERDAAIIQWAKHHRGRVAATQDRRLEMVSHRIIAPDEQIQALAAMEASDA